MEENEGWQSRLSPAPLYEAREYAKAVDDVLRGRATEAQEKFILARLWHYGDRKEELIKDPEFLSQHRDYLLRKLVQHEFVLRELRIPFDPWDNHGLQGEAERLSGLTRRLHQKLADAHARSQARPPPETKPRPRKARPLPGQLKPVVVRVSAEDAALPAPPAPTPAPVRTVSPPSLPEAAQAAPQAAVQAAAQKDAGSINLPDAWYRAACAAFRANAPGGEITPDDRSQIYERYGAAYKGLRAAYQGRQDMSLDDQDLMSAVAAAAGEDAIGLAVSNAFNDIAPHYRRQGEMEVSCAAVPIGAAPGAPAAVEDLARIPA